MINLNEEKKIIFLSIELTTLQIFHKQGNLDLNAITTWPRSLLFIIAPNLKIAQYSLGKNFCCHVMSVR